MKSPSIPEGLIKITPKDKLPLLESLAVKIMKSNRGSIEALIAHGRSLTVAKLELGQIWGKSTKFGWKLFLDKKCHIGESSASKLMTISNSAAICDPQNWPKLPLSSESLYELAHKLSDDKLQAMLDKGEIRDKTHSQIQDLIEGRERNSAKSKRNSANTPDTLQLGLAVPVEMSADGQERVAEFTDLVERVKSLVASSSFSGVETLTDNLNEVRKRFVPETINA